MAWLSGPHLPDPADGVQVKALSKELISEIAASYGEAAGLAKRAGFEMLMIHGGHGWLINQFLSLCLIIEKMNMADVWKTAAALRWKFFRLCAVPWEGASL